MCEDPTFNLAPLDDILDSMGRIGPDDLIPLLQAVQRHYGYLPHPVLRELPRRTGIEATQIHGVVTFYEQFHTKPRGRHTVRCCRGTACHVKKGQQIIDEVQRVLEVEEGETTADRRYTFETVAWL